MNILEMAQEIFDIESKAILQLKDQLTADFEEAVKEIHNSDGKLIVIGMGKSGIVGKKIAATLASTGTPSFFLHPGEAYHGDLGMIESRDVVLLISNSGETKEVLSLIPFLRDNNNVTIAITGNKLSTLASFANYHLNVKVGKEGCPLNLAPMSSTTATMVMGDALASALMKISGFKNENFAKFHPGGSLGKQLSSVESIIKNSVAICDENADIKTIIKKITMNSCGLVVIIENEKPIGIITDGDIRRAMDEKETSFFNLEARDIMTVTPKKITKETTILQAKKIMTGSKVNSLIVVNEDDRLLGCVEMYDMGL